MKIVIGNIMNNQQYGHVFWITGLSGSGKTSFSDILQQQFSANNIPFIVIDGDVIRDIFGETTDYDRDSRLKLAYRNARLCKFLSHQGMNVICATISLFHEVQDWNHQHITHYHEIFIKRDIEILIAEDHKNIYRKAKVGDMKNVVGIDITPEFPKNPDMIIDHSPIEALHDYADKICQKFFDL